MKLSGSDIIVRTLIEQGVQVVFGYPGGQVINIYDSLYKYRDELKHVLTAHEQGATHAADGYARASGQVGVVIATSGPGATNLVTGIATAYLDSVPMVAITGNVPNSTIGTDGFQEIDITGITLPITKHNYFVGDIADLADTIRDAFRLAKSGRPGPVLIDVPKDVQVAQWEFTPQPEPVPADLTAPAKEIRIQQAAACINSAQRPVLYFGGGLITSDAQDELLQMAETIDAPIGCSLMGISGIPTEAKMMYGYTIYGENQSGATFVTINIVVNIGKCPAVDQFPETVVGETAVYECSNDGAYIGSLKKTCVLGEKDGEWAATTGFCMKTYVLYIIICVVVIIIIVVVAILVSKNKKAAPPPTKSTGSVKPSASKKSLSKKSSAKTTAVKV